MSRLKVISTFLLLALMLSFVPAGATVTHAAAATVCDWAQFVADVTVPDGTNFAPGTTFNKTWRLKNIGTCTWAKDTYALVFDSGERMGAPAAVNFPINVAPGQTVDLTVAMTAPTNAGHFFSFWKLRNSSGVIFGIGSTANKAFWAEINVSGGGTGVAYDFTTNVASATWVSGTGFAQTVDNPKFESGVQSAQHGLLFVPNNVTNGFTQGTYPAFRVNNGDRFQATIGCEFNATGCYVEYRLMYQIGSNAAVTFWTFREKYEGWTYNVNLDLSRLAGQDVKFILFVSAYGSPVGDRALWGNPIIARAGAGTPVTPSPTVTGTPPTPTPTFTPGAACTDRARFVSDVTVRDGTTFAPNTVFTKTWRILNIGTCTWTTNYSMIFDTGNQMGGPNSVPMPTNVAPGQTVDVSVQLTAPATAGSYRGYWKFKNPNGVAFGLGTAGTISWWVDIRVSGTPVTPSTPGTPVTPGPPAAGASYDFAANICAASWYSGASSSPLPCPGTDGDARGFVLYKATPKLESGALDTRPGLLTFPQNINNGYIQGIYPAYTVKSGDRFRATIGCEGGSTSCYVVYRLDYSLSGSSSVQTFWAFVEKLEGLNYNADLDLTPLVGQNVKFILTILSTGSPTGDRALWIAPMIYNPVPPAAATFTPTATVAPATATMTNTPGPTATNTPTPTSTPTFTPTP